MNRIVLNLFFLSLYFSNTFCQHYEGYAQRMFLYQQPNARAEALGRGQVTLYDSPFSMFNNPASPAFSSGVNVEFTHMDPNYPFKTNGFYNTYGLSYNIGKFGAIGFNYLSFSFGEEPGAFSNYSDFNFNKLYILNYSKQLFNDFSIGINLNYFFDKATDMYNKSRTITFDTYYFDLGLLKRFSLSQSGGNNLYLGLSLINAGYSEARHTFFKDPFPTIMHLGASYEFQFGERGYHDLLPLKLLLCGEYLDLFETRYFTQVRFGVEATLWEILKLRAGNWTETLDPELFTGTQTALSNFTYGIGVELPMNKLLQQSLPLALSLDYTYLPLPNYDDYTYRDPFNDLIYTGPGFESYNKNYYIFSLDVKVGI